MCFGGQEYVKESMYTVLFPLDQKLHIRLQGACANNWCLDAVQNVDLNYHFAMCRVTNDRVIENFEVAIKNFKVIMT